MNDYLDLLNDFSFDELDVSEELGDYSSFNFDAYGDTSDGTEGDDYIVNYSDEVKILVLGGDDTVENAGSYVYIDGSAGADQITNTDGAGNYSGSFVFINGGEGDDTIQNGDESSAGGDNVTITGGAGNDYIENNNYHDGDISNSANALISGGDGDDTIYNYNAPDATILGGDGKDFIENYGSNALIGGGTDNDSIFSSGSNSSISGGAGNDSIKNTGDNVSIGGGEGDDSISNEGMNVSIFGGAGNDSISNYVGHNALIGGGDGNDFISNDGDNALISGGAGDDYIENDGDTVTINAGAGNDSIYGCSKDSKIDGGAGDDYIEHVSGLGPDFGNNTLYGGSGNDTISSDCDNVTIDAGEGDDYIVNGNTDSNGYNVSINGGEGNNTISNHGSFVTIRTGSGADNVWSDHSNNLIDTGAGNDNIDNDSTNSTINAGEGDDFIQAGERSTVYAGAGKDSVLVGKSDNVIFAQDGNDSIKIQYDANNISVDGGKGNDMFINEGSNITFAYTDGDGNDSIYGFNETSTLIISGGTYSTQQGNKKDIIVTVGEGSITLKDAANLSAVNINGEEISLTPEWTLDGTTATYGTPNETLITVTGVKSVDGLSEPSDNNVVTIAKASVNAKNITISDGYTLALADDVTKPETTNAWAFSGTTAKYNQTTSAGYTLTNNEIIYSKKSTTPLVTVEGVTSKDGLSLSGDVVTVSATSLGTNEVTISDGYTLALADDVETSSTKAADWSLDGTTATYNGASTTEGYTLASDGKSISYSGETTATSLATVKGATSTGGLTISGNTIKLAAGSLSKAVTVASDDYNFDFVSGYNNGKITGSGSDDTIKTAGQKVTVSAGKGDDVITVSGKYSSVVGGAGNDSIKNTGANVSISGGKGNDTIENTGDNVVFTYTSGDGNDLIRGYNETSTLQVSNSSFSTEKSGDDVIVSVDSAKITLEGAASLFPDNVPIWYMLDTDVAVFGTATETYLTVSGVKSSYGFEFDGTTVIVPSTCLNKKNVTITDGYKLAVDDDVKEPTTITEAAWSFDSTTFTATYTSAATTEGYSVSSDGKSIIYNAAQEATDLLTVKGVKSLDGLSLNGTVVTVAKASLTNKNVTISDGYSLKLAKNVAAPSDVDAEWTLDETTATATYMSESKTKGYTLASDAKSIKYSKATTATALASIEGATSTDGLTISGNTIKATAASELDKVIYLGSDDYGFDFVSGYKSANINGSGDDDTIKAAGQKVTINGGDGNDSIVATGKYALVDGGDGADFIKASGAGASLGGGKGNDTLTGGSGANVFLYANGDGKDVITDYSETQGDKIKITSGSVTSITTSKTNVVFTVGKGKLTVQNASEQVVTYIEDGEEKFYTNKPVRYNDAGTSATLTSNYTEDNFTPTEYADYSKTLRTIDASAVTQELTIEGNKLANNITGSTQNDFINGFGGADVLYGGAGADTLAGSSGNDKLYGEDGNDSLSGGSGDDTLVGGQGKDSLTGGAGADVFSFSVGDGANVITDYSEEQGDKISINAAASSIKYEIGKSNVLFTFGKSDRVTLKNSAEQAITFVDADGVETVINNKSVLYNDAGTSATLTTNYTEDAFTATEYADYSKTLRTIDASAVTHDLTIEGNKLANNITGSTQDDFINGFGGADVLYGGAGADTLAGSSGNDKLYGEDGNDSLSGGSGDDTLVGGQGRDSLTGGAGADVFSFSVGDGANVITDYSEEQGDKISINAAASSIKYEIGKSNVLFTFGESDRITLKNGAEQEITFVDDSNTTYYVNKPIIYNEANTAATLTSNYEAKTFTPTEYADYATTLVTIDASAVTHDLTITGNKKANRITGSTQDDTIDGAGGSDKLYGGTGNDSLSGGSGNDYLNGGAGDDTLWGGKGTDTLVGGKGRDTFIYNAGEGNKTIADYSPKLDTVIVNGDVKGLAANTSTGDVVFTMTDGAKLTFTNCANTSVVLKNSSNKTIKNGEYYGG